MEVLRCYRPRDEGEYGGGDGYRNQRIRQDVHENGQVSRVATWDPVVLFDRDRIDLGEGLSVEFRVVETPAMRYAPPQG